MKNITSDFQQLYVPVKALVVYESIVDESSVYVEAFDADQKGFLINAHPLSVRETEMLAETLRHAHEFNNHFLRPKGLLPENILHLDAGKEGQAIWYSHARTVNLFFKEDLGIPNGKAHVPPMVWKASLKELSVFALGENKKPSLKTPLFHAPFFNIHRDGKVCMGTVDIDIEEKSSLEDFMQAWENYFFNSRFSHLLQSDSPVSCNIIQLWQQQVASKRKFPMNILVKTGDSLKKIIP